VVKSAWHSDNTVQSALCTPRSDSPPKILTLYQVLCVLQMHLAKIVVHSLQPKSICA